MVSRFEWNRASPEEKRERSINLINKNVDKSTGCWIWKGYKGKFGYPIVHYDRKPTQLHRFSFQLFKGDIPKEMQVCHSCDNRACANPDHLWLGTAKDNAQDRNNKKRNADVLGSKNGASKLNEEQVIEIKKMLKQGKSLPEIAKLFNAKRENIWCIKKGISWSHVNVSP